MENKPRVTVITGYYNRENFVDASIMSLLKQTYDNLEIIIIDDNSSDNTYQKLKAVTIGFDNVQIIRNNTNKGFTNSLIETIRKIESKYIAVHGSGDISMDSRIARQVDFLENNPDAGLVAVDVLNSRQSLSEIREITYKDFLKKNPIAHGAVMFRKSVYEEVGGYREFFTFRQDFDLWTRMSFVTKIYKLPFQLYKINVIKNSVSQDVSNSKFPTLQTFFVHFLLRERLKYGMDSLDKYGVKAALAFTPSKCNKILYKKVLFSLKNLNFKHAEIYCQHLVEFNPHSIRGSFFVLLKIVFKNLSLRKN